MNRPAGTLLPDAGRADLATRLLENLDPSDDDDIESA